MKKMSKKSIFVLVICICICILFSGITAGADTKLGEPDIDIYDIDSLKASEKQAVMFMADEGFFRLNYGRFYPDSAFTRDAFTEAMARMIFVWENGYELPFAYGDTWYYRRQAAKQIDNALAPVGSYPITAEKVMAVAGATLNQRKGYAYPEDSDTFLMFSEDNPIGEWSEENVALAVREGIYETDMRLTFNDTISRKDAAVMLYRLFVIMTDTPDVSEIKAQDNEMYSVRESGWNLTNTIVICSAVAVPVVIAGALVLFFLKKKKETI